MLREDVGGRALLLQLWRDSAAAAGGLVGGIPARVVEAPAEIAEAAARGPPVEPVAGDLIVERVPAHLERAFGEAAGEERAGGSAHLEDRRLDRLVVGPPGFAGLALVLEEPGAGAGDLRVGGRARGRRPFLVRSFAAGGEEEQGEKDGGGKNAQKATHTVVKNPVAFRKLRQRLGGKARRVASYRSQWRRQLEVASLGGTRPVSRGNGRAAARGR